MNLFIINKLKNNLLSTDSNSLYKSNDGNSRRSLVVHQTKPNRTLFRFPSQWFLRWCLISSSCHLDFHLHKRILSPYSLTKIWDHQVTLSCKCVLTKLLRKYQEYLWNLLHKSRAWIIARQLKVRGKSRLKHLYPWATTDRELSNCAPLTVLIFTLYHELWCGQTHTAWVIRWRISGGSSIPVRSTIHAKSDSRRAYTFTILWVDFLCEFSLRIRSHGLKSSPKVSTTETYPTMLAMPWLSNEGTAIGSLRAGFALLGESES